MKTSTFSLAAVLPLGMLILPQAVSALTQGLGPLPYLSAADSPFVPLNIPGFQLEDFEDGVLNTPGVTATSGGSVIGPDPQADSVDGDDGAIDGSGAAGRSLLSINPDTTVLTFEFDAGVLGGLPTHAGLVWTDVGNLLGAGTPGFGDVLFEAFDAADQVVVSVGAAALGDGSTFGATDEDRFFGARHDPGIARISLTMVNSNDFEIDHLQYGVAPIPLPGALLLFTSALAGLAARRRRAH